MLFSILITALICGLLSFLVRRAPFIDAEWKGYTTYTILVVFVIWLISFLFPGAFSGVFGRR